MAEGGGGVRSLLQFVPFVSRVEAGFWHELCKLKLEKYQLSEEATEIRGSYTNSESAHKGTPHALQTVCLSSAAL